MNDYDTKPQKHKVVIICSGDKIYYLGFADKSQEERIMAILRENKRIAH